MYIYIYIHVYMYVYMYMYICIHIYIERERDYIIYRTLAKTTPSRRRVTARVSVPASRRILYMLQKY